jgi:hypothetical protein
MIIMVPDFSGGVVNFIFSGRNSGQLQAKADSQSRRRSSWPSLAFQREETLLNG